LTAELGQAVVAAGLLATICAALWWTKLALDLQRGRGAPRRLVELAVTGTLAAFGAAVAAASAMEWALLTHDFSVRYVAENGSRDTPTFYTVVSLWAALGGSLILWLLILGAVTVAVTRRALRNLIALNAWAVAVLNIAGIFFFGLVLFTGHAFDTTSPVPTDGPGPNPLLQNHPLMAVHPPLLYLGYIALTVPFAYAVAALITGQTGPVWVAAVRCWTLTAWTALMMAIILGGWWSYEVLGWGGYWSWDPVENVAIVPWFVATALLHTTLVQSRKGTLRLWNISLALAAYLLVLVGTFLTRSEVIESVHSFTRSDVGPVLLAFIVTVLLISGSLLVWRSERLGNDQPLGGGLSRQTMFLLNNLLLVGLALTVLFGTVFPLLAEALAGARFSVGAPYFNRITVPLILAILVMMGVGPLMPWGRTDARTVVHRLAMPVAVAAATSGLLGLAGVRGLRPLAAFGAAAFVAAAIAAQYAGSVRIVCRRRRLNPFRAAALVLIRSRRFHGGMLVHLGVAVAATAIAASGSYTESSHRTLRVGQSIRVGPYTATLAAIETHEEPRRKQVLARMRLSRGRHVLGTYAPALSMYPNSAALVGTPAVRTTLRDDAYLTMQQVDDARRWAMIGLSVRPLVVWLWISAVVMVGGALIAGWPGRRPRSLRFQRIPAHEQCGGEIPA
jgi:cytochrome c-type biogenesis protein CcmF